jgi:ABC-type lipoprotein release transport system permease subunit
MNGLQIYLLGCLLAYPIAVSFAKILKEPRGIIEKAQAIFKQLNFEIKANFFYNCIVFAMVVLSWVMVILWLYLHIKYLFSLIKYYIFRK